MIFLIVAPVMKQLWPALWVIGLLAAGCDAPGSAGAARSGDQSSLLNGFDVSDASVPPEEILRGGPPRDGIPSIDNPIFIAPDDAVFLKPDDTVLSYGRGDDVRAYPFRILVWHEVVNDNVGDKPVAVTYCPLCGTAMVFSRETNGETLTFGVSGLLHHSDVLLYDRETESLWTQIGTEAISGPKRGEELKWLPSRQMKWAAWQEAHPAGKVLSTDTGHARDYARSSYGAYAESPGTMFPVPTHRDELALKAWVIGVQIAGEAAAYPVERLPSGEWVQDEMGGDEIRIRYDDEAQTAEVKRAENEEELPHVFSYWFAWQAFYPETSVWER